MVDTRIIVKLPMLPGNNRICPYCNHTTSLEIARCNVIINNLPGPMIQTVLYCKYCKIFYGNNIIVLNIYHGPNTSNKSNHNTTTREMPWFSVKGLKKADVFKRMYGEETAEQQPIKQRIQKQVNQPAEKQTSNHAFIRGIKEVNCKRTIQNLFPVPIDLSYCPKCNSKLWTEYVHAIPINKTQCVTIKGQLCESCDALYSSEKVAISYLKLKGSPNRNYTVFDNYIRDFDQSRINEALYNTKSFYKLIYLVSALKLKVLVIVFEKKDENINKDTYHYTNPKAIEILIAEKFHQAAVFEGLEYRIEKTIVNNNVSLETSNEIDRIVTSAYGNRDQDLTADTTLYVYNGIIKCNTAHELIPYRAQIEALDKRYRFLVYYCPYCERFMMKYADYEGYLKKYSFFPMKVKLVKDNSDWDDDYDWTDGLAAESPLMLMGYNVNANVGLSSTERQRILAYIMDNDMLSDFGYSSTQRRILDYLDFFIERARNRPMMSLAVSKWREDRHFVLNYRISSHPSVVIGKLKRW